MTVKKTYRLEDLIVEEVSIVDRPANKRRWLMVKAEGVEMADRGSQVVVDENGQLVTGEDPATSGDSVEVADVAFAFAEAGETLARIEKSLALPSEFRRAIYGSLYDGMRRLGAVLNVTEYARTDDEGATPLVPLLVGELADVAVMIGKLSKELGKVAKGEDPDLASIQKAEWTTAQVNDFPDSSFLYVKPGGKKDAGGKTVPRSNRMFPVRNAAGNLDIPHLRNAISRAPQSNLPDATKKQIQDKARKLLAEAQKKKFTDAGGVTKKELGGDPDFVGQLFELVEAVDGGASPAFAERLEQLVESVEKRGAKMSKDRLSKLKAAVETLAALVKELDVGNAPPPASAPGKQPPKAAKGSDVRASAVTKSLETLEAAVGKIAAAVTKQGKDVARLQKSVPPSNTIPAEGGRGPVAKEDDDYWPFDMNDPKDRDSVDTATSFHDS